MTEKILLKDTQNGRRLRLGKCQNGKKEPQCRGWGGWEGAHVFLQLQPILASLE